MGREMNSVYYEIPAGQRIWTEYGVIVVRKSLRVRWRPTIAFYPAASPSGERLPYSVNYRVVGDPREVDRITAFGEACEHAVSHDKP